MAMINGNGLQLDPKIKNKHTVHYNWTFRIDLRIDFQTTTKQRYNHIDLIQQTYSENKTK